MQLRPLLSAALAIALGAASFWLWEHRKPAKNPPDLRGLRDQLSLAAEKNLPLPNLETAPLPTPFPAADSTSVTPTPLK